jgi:hypothetical protein
MTDKIKHTSYSFSFVSQPIGEVVNTDKKLAESIERATAIINQIEGA